MSLLSFTKRITGRTADKKSAAKKTEKPEATSAATVTNLRASAIGLEPIVTEKSVRLQSIGNVVAFRVKPAVTKGQVALAVAERYGVTPTAVRTQAMRGKRRRRGQSLGRTNAWKKVYVTLPAGKTIDIAA